MLKVPLLVKGIRHRRGCSALRRARRGRHHRLEPRRPLDGLRSVDARSAAGDRGGREPAAIPVLTDSGYRRGSDILKALALGAERGAARARATRWALGAFGRAGRATAARDDAAGACRRGRGRWPPDTRIHRQGRHQDALSSDPSRHATTSPRRQERCEAENGISCPGSRLTDGSRARLLETQGVGRVQ